VNYLNLVDESAGLDVLGSSQNPFLELFLNMGVPLPDKFIWCHFAMYLKVFERKIRNKKNAAEALQRFANDLPTICQNQVVG
jgi:hypothetical protein